MNVAHTVIWARQLVDYQESLFPTTSRSRSRNRSRDGRRGSLSTCAPPSPPPDAHCLRHLVKRGKPMPVEVDAWTHGEAAVTAAVRRHMHCHLKRSKRKKKKQKRSPSTARRRWRRRRPQLIISPPLGPQRSSSLCKKARSRRCCARAFSKCVRGHSGCGLPPAPTRRCSSPLETRARPTLSRAWRARPRPAPRQCCRRWVCGRRTPTLGLCSSRSTCPTPRERARCSRRPFARGRNGWVVGLQGRSILSQGARLPVGQQIVLGR